MIGIPSINFYIRTLAIFFLCGFVFGCASNKVQQGEGFSVSESSNVSAVEPNPDPYEGFNRKIHGFNMFFDTWFFRPLAKGYVWLAPKPVEVGVGNFFDNLGEISNVINDVFQWKWKNAGRDSGRFLINSTIGIGGLFDVARPMGLAKGDGEDFGQTLAAWGVGSGPYLVLPFMGPSTLRDTAGMPVNWYTSPITYVDNVRLKNSLRGLELVHLRSELLPTEELASGDLYLFFRDAYLQRREFLINDGAVEDDFGDFDEEDLDF